jgi:hypothetical protein
VKPGDAAGMLRINGIGHSKLTKYGDEVLAIVAGEPLGDQDDPGDRALS